MCRFAGVDVEISMIDPHDQSSRDELLLMSPSFLVPCLTIDGLEIWDTLAIGEYLNERNPDSGLLPADAADRALCRSVCGEMHSGFASLRSAMPMNMKARHIDFKIFTGARADIDRIEEIWRLCLERSGGPFLFGDRPTMADAMYAPVCSRLHTYSVKPHAACAGYVDHMLGLSDLVDWTNAARSEPDEILELEAEF
jgi:glutathione S-transferase